MLESEGFKNRKGTNVEEYKFGNSYLDKLNVTAMGFEIQMKRIAAMAKSSKISIKVKKLKLDKEEEIDKLSTADLRKKKILTAEIDKELEMLHLCELALEKLHAIKDLCIKK